LWLHVAAVTPRQQWDWSTLTLFMIGWTSEFTKRQKSLQGAATKSSAGILDEKRSDGTFNVTSKSADDQARNTLLKYKP
jgi:hypothetical protein